MDSKEKDSSLKRSKSVAISKKNTRSASVMSENLDAQREILWEKEKQKLEKKYEATRRAIEKERKKIETERKAADKKHHKFLKEKKEIDRQKIQLNNEKEVWLGRKRKNNDADSLLSLISEKTKGWEERKEEAKAEWVDIEEKRAEMKEQHISITEEQEKLKADWVKLEEDKKEFATKSQNLADLNKKNEEHKSRLSEMENILKQGENAVEERRKDYETKDQRMKERESLVVERDARLKKEHALMEDIKKNIYITFEQRRAELISQSKLLNSEMATWNSSYNELFGAVNKSGEFIDGDTKDDAIAAKS